MPLWSWMPIASATELEIRKRLGGGFTNSLLELEPGTWHGPVLSGFGVHLVYVFERIPAPVPLLADLQPRVLEAWHTSRVDEFQQQFYQELKRRYQVIIEAPNLPPGSILQIPERAAGGAAGAREAGS
jgi:hypothetical protein